MKAIMISLTPKECMNLLNGDLSVLVRKQLPKNYIGWMFVYCTKGKPFVFREITYEALAPYPHLTEHPYQVNNYCPELDTALNGKVIARFWCDKVEYVENTYDEFRWGEEDYNTETLNPDVLYEKSCLSFEEMDKYLKGDCGYAIHVTKVEPFDEPKELREFYGAFTQKRHEHIFGNNTIELDEKYGGLRQPTKSGYEYVYPLTRAPSTYCYIEV